MCVCGLIDVPWPGRGNLHRERDCQHILQTTISPIFASLVHRPHSPEQLFFACLGNSLIWVVCLYWATLLNSNIQQSQNKAFKSHLIVFQDIAADAMY